MDSEQQSRFESLRQLVDEARAQVDSLQVISQKHLSSVNNHSAAQAEQLQKIQQSAGSVVQAMNEVAEIARHARSYQAQAHHSSS